MYFSAQSEAGIRMVTRMHYRQQHYQSNGSLKSIIGKNVVRCGGLGRNTIHRREAQGAYTNRSFANLEHAFKN